MTALLIAMTIALMMPIYSLCRESFLDKKNALTAIQSERIWSKMLAFTSISTKTSVMILVVSVWRDDWMIGLVGVLILSVGNASLMLIAHTLRRLNTKRDVRESWN